MYADERVRTYNTQNRNRFSNYMPNYIHKRESIQGERNSIRCVMINRRMQNDVYNKTGFKMKTDVKFVDEYGIIKPAHLV